MGRFAHQERLAGAPGERKARSDSCRPRFETAVCAHNRPKRNESQSVCPLLVGQTGVNPEPTARAAGTAGPAGSARTRSRVQTLENPFLGNGNSFPQNTAGGRPLLVGLPPSKTTIAACEVKRRTPAPCVTGRGFVESEPTALDVGTAD